MCWRIRTKRCFQLLVWGRFSRSTVNNFLASLSPIQLQTFTCTGLKYHMLSSHWKWPHTGPQLSTNQMTVWRFWKLDCSRAPVCRSWLSHTRVLHSSSIHQVTGVKCFESYRSKVQPIVRAAGESAGPSGLVLMVFPSKVLWVKWLVLKDWCPNCRCGSVTICVAAFCPFYRCNLGVISFAPDNEKGTMGSSRIFFFPCHLSFPIFFSPPDFPWT